MATEATHQEVEAGRGYEALFVPALFAPWTGHVLDQAAIEEGSHVLDIACGSGVLARAALVHCGKSGRVVGLDPAPGMIAAAREVEPGIDWIVGNAENLPFEHDSFDCAVSQFGMMFFQDRLEACREMYRVLRQGGRLTLALWHSIDRNPAYKDIADLLNEQVSLAAANAEKMPFCLGQPEEVAALLSQAGFENISFETRSALASFPSTRTMVEAELRGWLPLFDIHLTEDKIADVLAKSDARMAKHATPSGEAEFETFGYVMTALKLH